jgi:serine/threonine protein kinase
LADDSTHDLTEVVSRFSQAREFLSRFRDAPVPSPLPRFVSGHIDGDRSYLVLEHISGPSLRDAVERQQSVQPGSREALELGMRIIDAIAFLHEHGAIYLDLKPENVLLRHDDSAAIVDYNTARLNGTDDTLFYRDGYKAPEQTPGEFEDHLVDNYSDVYACGKLLCYLLTGEELNENPTDGIDLADLDGTLHDELRRIVRKATFADPQRRFSSAKPLRHALRNAVGSAANATLYHQPTDTTLTVYPEFTLGRTSESSPIPSITYPDDEQYLSPRHVRFDYRDGHWVLEDLSTNGTYVRPTTSEEWRFVISRDGYRRQQEQETGRVGSDQPSVEFELDSSVAVAPVDPEYATSVTFSP